ncbi:hypothetical protein [Roseateles sp.]|uniref:hypothetical protein n=1 Tax=Roseateles sp. TaxID=1971397 RepID=UPI003265E9A8
MIWLLLVCIPAQAGVSASLRAMGPAHSHAGAPTLLQVAYQWAKHTVNVVGFDHATSHWREHAGSGLAHHDHDATDTTVVLVADPGDAGSGAGPAGGKVSSIDLPAILPCELVSPVALVTLCFAWAVAVAFNSVVTRLPYRPPR